MLNNYKMKDTFSDSYRRFTRIMSIMRYNNLDECDKFTDYRIGIKNTFKIKPIKRIMYDNKFLNDEITDYK